MKKTYLVQRLVKPRNYAGKFAGLENAFCFGGGLKNGGLSDEAMELLKPIFSFDYMGSAEFEWGAVPEALSQIAKEVKEYEAFEVTVSYKCKDYRNKKDLKGKRSVYIICKTTDKEEVVNRIKTFAKNTFNNTKECINLDQSLAEIEFAKETIGWLELDNGFLFFKDEEAFKKVAKLFELSK